MRARPPGGGFGVAEHDADLLAELVDEDEAGRRLRHHRGELAQGLRHQPRLQADLRIAHLAVDLRPRHEGGHGVDDDDVGSARPHQHLDDLEGLLAVVGLGDQEVVEVDAQLLGVGGVEGVLGVDERGGAAAPLGLGDDLQGQRGLARRLGPEDLDDAAAGDAADAQRVVDADRSGRDAGHRGDRALPEPHDGALAELFLDLAHRHVDGLVALAQIPFLGHGYLTTCRRHRSGGVRKVPVTAASG